MTLVTFRRSSAGWLPPSAPHCNKPVGLALESQWDAEAGLGGTSLHILSLPPFHTFSMCSLHVGSFGPLCSMVVPWHLYCLHSSWDPQAVGTMTPGVSQQQRSHDFIHFTPLEEKIKKVFPVSGQGPVSTSTWKEYAMICGPVLNMTAD